MVLVYEQGAWYFGVFKFLNTNFFGLKRNLNIFIGTVYDDFHVSSEIMVSFLCKFNLYDYLQFGFCRIEIISSILQVFLNAFINRNLNLDFFS